MGNTADAERTMTEAPRVDRRVRRSRRAIIGAFGRLIAEMPLEDITVSALAREADVDRKTFYQHFGTIDRLLDAVAEEVVSDMLDEAERAAGVGPGSELDERLTRELLVALVERLGGDLSTRRRLYENIPADVLVDHLSRPLMSQVVARGLVMRDQSGPDLEMTLAFVLGGVFSLYRWWLLSDQATSSEELAGFAVRMIEGDAGRLVRQARPI